MKISKLGHCCLLIEAGAVKIITDPGGWTDYPDSLAGIDLCLITHEHSDHLHLEALKSIMQQNPGIKIITNNAVAKILAEAGIQVEVLVHGNSREFKGVNLAAYGTKHAEVYPGITPVENTGYLIANKFFYPGDAFFDPQLSEIALLALPVAGPWMHIAEALDYAKQLKPKLCFPVHDGMLKHFGPYHALPQKFLGEAGIEFKPLLPGETIEIAD